MVKSKKLQMKENLNEGDGNKIASENVELKCDTCSAGKRGFNPKISYKDQHLLFEKHSDILFHERTMATMKQNTPSREILDSIGKKYNIDYKNVFIAAKRFGISQ